MQDASVNAPAGESSLDSAELQGATTPKLGDLTRSRWCEIFSALPLSGVCRVIASHCLPVKAGGEKVQFALLNANATLFKPEAAQRLAKGLSIYYGHPVECTIELIDNWTEVGIDENSETPIAFRERLSQEKRAGALKELEDDENLKALLETFDGNLDEQSLEFIDKP